MYMIKLMIIYDVVNISSMKNYKSSKKIGGGRELVHHHYNNYSKHLAHTFDWRSFTSVRHKTHRMSLDVEGGVFPCGLFHYGDPLCDRVEIPRFVQSEVQSFWSFSSQTTMTSITRLANQSYSYCRGITYSLLPRRLGHPMRVCLPQLHGGCSNSS